MADTIERTPLLSENQTEALVRLLRYLDFTGYQFTTVTPATHARVVNRRADHVALTLRDMLGWSLPFRPCSIHPTVEALLAEAGMLTRREDGLAQSDVRVSTVHGRLFLHSAYPTLAENSVFLGPDTYRFADLIERELKSRRAKEAMIVLDIGTGAGVGAIIAADLLPHAWTVMTDINPYALALARINGRYAGHEIEDRLGRNLAGCGDVDVALANPPYVVDPAGRAYRDGGGMHGAAIAIEMTEGALAALRAGGTFILYTGSAIVNGDDPLRGVLEGMARQKGASLRYRELDPDVFGEELDTPGYADVDRIAVVAAVFDMP